MDELSELLKEVRRIQAQSTRLVKGVMAGGYSSVFKGSGIEFHELREYVDGDDPRNVDWNVTARMGRPFIKEYVEERELTLLFLLDLSASMNAGFGTWSMRQMAARVCACLGLSAIRNDDRVGLVGFSEGIDKFVPPRKGIRHALRIVRDCLALRGSGKGTNFQSPLDFVVRALQKHSVIFLVSDFMGASFGPSLSLCAKKHDLVAVRLLPPEQQMSERAGLVRLRDPETGRIQIVDWRNDAVRRAYQEEVVRWREQGTREFRRAGVDLMDVPIPELPNRDAVVKPILEFFRMREKREAKR